MNINMKQRPIIVLLFLLASFIPAQAQEPLKEFNQFFTGNTKKIDAPFPVYTSEKQVFIEIPQNYIGREIIITAQIDRGFDLLSRPTTSLGVVRILSPDKHTICFQQPFYEERLLSQHPTYQKSFDLSNTQSSGVSYPVVAYSPRQGAIIEVTDQLLNGDDWFQYNYNFIRSLVSNLSRITQIHPFKEGVSFTIRRYHGHEGQQNNFSSSIIKLPEGSIPLDLTCTVRLLPIKPDPIRLADDRAPYQTIKFKDYAHNPYGMVKDSLILHWDLTSPLMFYVDTLFPKEHFEAMKKGVLAWNEALRKAGIPSALQVAYLPKSYVSAEQQAFIAYDLRMPGVTENVVAHPRTGEILSARINIGHGFLRDRMDDYLLKYGATDPRSASSRYAKTIEAELMQYEVMRAMGRVLGLNSSISGTPPLPWSTALRVNQQDIQAIGYGYAPTKGKNYYAQREYLRKWLPTHSAEPLSTAPLMDNLLQVLPRLDQLLYPNKRPQDRGLALTALYRKGLHMYASNLQDIAASIGSQKTAQAQRQAIVDLDTYLFHPKHTTDNNYINANLLVDKNKELHPHFTKMFDRLFSQATITALRRQSLQREGYGEADFFSDLRKQLFNNFDPNIPISYELLDLQIICLQSWLQQIRKNDNDVIVRITLQRELHQFHKHLQSLSQSHAQQSVRDVYTLLSSQIQAQQ